MHLSSRFNGRSAVHLIVDMQAGWVSMLAEGDKDLPKKIDSFVLQTMSYIPAHYIVTHNDDMYSDENWGNPDTPYRLVLPVRGDFARSATPLHIPAIKKGESALSSTDTGLAEVLKKMGIEIVLVSGMNRRACVYKTAQDAVKHGFLTVVLNDLAKDALTFAGSQRPPLTAELAHIHNIFLIESTDIVGSIAENRGDPLTQRADMNLLHCHT